MNDFNKKLIERETKKIEQNAREIFQLQIKRKMMKPVYLLTFFFIK